MYKHAFQIPNDYRIRVIICADAKNEVDDQFAITYALLSPKIEVAGLAATHFEIHNIPDTMEQSYQEIKVILDKLGLPEKIPVLRGAPRSLVNEYEPYDSEAARFIIEQAHSDGFPLYVICSGAITDLASAYLMDPSIAHGIEAAVWLGGNEFPVGGSEFNLANDIKAANVVMDSTLPLWLIPVSTSKHMRVSYAELVDRVKPCGAIGEYLVEQTLDFRLQAQGPHEESWIMWDISAISVVLNPKLHAYHEINAPRFDEKTMHYMTVERKHIIRVYDSIDPRFTIGDLYSKLSLFAKSQQ